MSALASGQKTQSMHDWVCTLRTESPPESMEDYLQSWEAFFDHYASQADYWHRRNAGYHNAIASLARFYIPSGSSVLEVGSGNGDLLAALQCSQGVWYRISPAKCSNWRRANIRTSNSNTRPESV